MKRHGKRILIVLSVYVFLLVLLVLAESHAEGASIRSFWDALWFSLITMTTVGYGDIAPVTPLGRALALIFALCSIGILAALIGVGLRIIGSELLPRLRLRFSRGRSWYFFNASGEDAAALAAALLREDPHCVPVFPSGGSGQIGGRKILRLDWTAEEVKRLRGGTEGVSLFFMGKDPWKNYTEALAACEEGLRCYCMADIQPERLPTEMQLFSPCEAMSRSYWSEHPLGKNESIVLLIGCGEAGSALLERALLINVFEKRGGIEYHVFDDTAHFAELHPETVKALDPALPDEDSLIFHAEDWTEARALIQRADRILLCCDRDEDNLKACEKLGSWFVSGAAVHVRLAERVPGLVSFGGREKSMRPEFVMKDELNRRARLMHDIYNEGSSRPRAWEDLSPFLRQSNIAAADHLLVKARCLLADESLAELSADDCRRAWERWRSLDDERRERLQDMEHRRWLRFYQLYNWSYAPVRSDAQRRHPMLLPYGELSAEDRAKDAYAWEMFARLAERS